MSDLTVDGAALATFGSAIATQTAVVGAECSASGSALGSGIVQDALGNVSLVLTVLDRALADGAGALARDARSTDNFWASADAGVTMRAV